MLLLIRNLVTVTILLASTLAADSANFNRTRPLASHSLGHMVTVQSPMDKDDSDENRIVVVVSKNNTMQEVDIETLGRIFLRQKNQWKNGWKITVFERSMDHPIRSKFSKIVLGKPPAKLHEYWMNLQLTRGIKKPKVLRSAALVKRYLQRVKGGIGYMYASEVDDTIRVIEISGGSPEPATR